MSGPWEAGDVAILWSLIREQREDKMILALFPQRDGTSYVEHGRLPFSVLSLGRSGRGSSPVVF